MRRSWRTVPSFVGRGGQHGGVGFLHEAQLDVTTV